jgi:hypothetical protein
MEKAKVIEFQYSGLLFSHDNRAASQLNMPTFVLAVKLWVIETYCQINRRICLFLMYSGIHEISTRTAGENP